MKNKETPESLIELYKEYIALLNSEIESLIGVANVHGWKSQNVEKGIELRNKIAQHSSNHDNSEKSRLPPKIIDVANFADSLEPILKSNQFSFDYKAGLRSAIARAKSMESGSPCTHQNTEWYHHGGILVCTDCKVLIDDNAPLEDRHPEDYCHKCNRDNPRWYAPNELFNLVNGDGNGIMCPICFLEMAKAKGLDLIFTVEHRPNLEPTNGVEALKGVLRVLDALESKPEPMGGKTLQECINKAREDRPNVSFSSDEYNVIKKAFDLYANKYLTKPSLLEYKASYADACSETLRMVNKAWPDVETTKWIDPELKLYLRDYILPEKITLCGSTKFKCEFELVNKWLSLKGHVVYTVSCFGHADNIPFTVEQKRLLDKVHKSKIDNSDAILVIDVDGYIGESTKSEIDHARFAKKKIYYLSSFLE